MKFSPTHVLAPCRRRLRQILSAGLIGALFALPSALLAAKPRPSAPPSPAPALGVLYPDLNPGIVGSAYAGPLYASGGTAPYAWSLTSGTLPPGLALAATGTITGTPTQSGNYLFSAQVRDVAAAVVTQAYALYIGALPLAILTQTVSPGTVGTPYAATLAASGGNAPYSWTAYGAILPPGLRLSGAGLISGTPTQAGSYSFQVELSDANSVAAFVTYTLSVNPGTTTPPPPPPPPAQVTYSLTVVGGTLNGGTASTGSFPPGTTVTITANAAPAGESFRGWTGATVANSAASPTTLVTRADSTTVTANDAPVSPSTSLTILYPDLDPTFVGVAYSRELYATGGAKPYTWTYVSGGLPPGLSVDPTGGTLSGTPTVAGNYNFVLQVSDSASATVSQQYNLYINPAAGTGTSSNPGSGTGSGPGPGSTPSYAVTLTNATLNGTSATTGSFAPGTTVTLTANPPPAGQSFQQWNGNAPVDNSFATTTTFTMPSSPVTESAGYFTPAPIPQPVTGHPRLWLTPADVVKYQGWATSGNPVYQQGIVPLLSQAVSDYTTQFFPNGVANPNYPDPGDTQGYTGLVSEQYALIFALNSLIDPSPAARIQYAQYARNLIMYALNQAVQGPLSGAPFRDPLFPTYNRANFTGEAWPLVVDWIYNATDSLGNPILSSLDKATIRTVFLQWAGACLNASTTGGDHPSPIGVVNSVSLLPGGNAYRMASNNYYLGHARLLTMMSLALDPADDPPLDPNTAPAVLGNSLRSYIADATGAWLYQEFAMLGDPSTVTSAYGLAPNASVGLASGGLPPEGMLYGHSYGFIFGQLLALKTAGFADPALSGPQAALANDPAIWNRFVQGFTSSLVPAPQVFPGYEYMGPVYQMASYGDILRLWITPDFAQPFGLLSLLDQQNGDSSRLNAERWFVVNALEGGSANLLGRIQSPWSYGVQDALLAFLLLDPNAAAATDPRPAWPTAFYDAPQGRLVEHSDWTPNASIFDFRCSWISINHQQADGNSFELYRKGEWLTKTVANYDNNSFGLTTDYHNTLSLQNWCANGIPANLGWWEGPFWAVGSQWQLGGSAGDPTTTTSVGTKYTYAYGDTTNLYNRPSVYTPANAALDILHASRSILWLKPDYVVIYDRATSHTAGLFKNFSLALTTAPTISGSLVTETTPGGQNLFITSLLPENPNITSVAIGNTLNPKAELEPSNFRVVINDPTNPTDTRFLHVLQGTDVGGTADPTALIQSTGGTAFDGVAILDTVVMFNHDMSAPFASVTYNVPVVTTQEYVTGLAANTGYTVTSQPNGATTQITLTLGGTTMTDQAGVLTF